MRRSTVLLFAALALVLAACQIRTDYGLLIEADTSAELAFEISYDGEAAELLGPAQGFLEEEIEDGIGSTIEGVTLLDATADSSDADRQRVAALFAAEDGAALDRLVDELFPGSSFTNVSGTTWQLTLRTDDDVATDFGEDFPFDDIAGEFLAGEVRVGYAGSQVSMQGGTDDGRNQIVWNPYGGQDLELVLDLSTGGAPPTLDDPAPDEPADAEEAAPDEEPAGEDPADEEPAVDDDVASDEDEPTAGTDEQDQEAAVTITEEDGGLSILLLAAIAGAALLLLLILLLVLRGRRRKEPAAAQPVAAGTDQAGWAPPAPTAPPGAAAPQQPWGGTPPSSGAPTQPLPPSGPVGSPPPGPVGSPPPGPAAPPPPPPPGNLPPPPTG